MNQREKLLGVGLLMTLGVAWGADSIQETWTTLTSPVELQLAEATESLEQLKLEVAASREKSRTLSDWKELSLPSDPSIAGIQYQELLVHLLDKSGISSPAINVASPIPLEGAGHRLQFTIQLNATLAQLGKFMDQFESSEVLHQMKQVQVQQADGPESGQCSITLVIEALALQSAEGSSLEKAKKKQSLGKISRQLATSGLFRKPAIVPPQNVDLSIQPLLSLFQSKSSESNTPAESVEAESADLSAKVPIKPKLVGIIGEGEQKTALIYKSPDESPVVVSENSNLAAIGRAGLIESITSDSVRVALEQAKITIRLGEHFDF